MTVQPTKNGTKGLLLLALTAPSKTTMVTRHVMAISPNNAFIIRSSAWRTVNAAPWACAYFSFEVIPWKQAWKTCQIHWIECFKTTCILLTLAMTAPSKPPDSWEIRYGTTIFSSIPPQRKTAMVNDGLKCEPLCQKKKKIIASFINKMLFIQGNF